MSAQYRRARKRMRQHERCYYCGDRFHRSAMTIDHAVPRSIGGTLARENIRYACRPCNEDKGSMLAEDYLELCEKRKGVQLFAVSATTGGEQRPATIAERVAYFAQDRRLSGLPRCPVLVGRVIVREGDR